MDRIGVIGGGAWGTALASVAARGGRDTVLWAREPEVVAEINDNHENSLFLKGIVLPPALAASGDMAAMADRDAVLLVCPAQFLRPVSGALAPHIRPGLPLVICAKGIELNSLKLLTTVLAETVPGATPAVLSGPTFAAEVARGLPSAVTLACADRDIGEALVAALGQRDFRPYLADDLSGAEIGGAIKNVLAIASGIVIGRGMGRNAHAALITRGMAEMLRLGARLGARAETLMGLCGLGDLILTCSSEQSRNMSLGVALGRGESLADIMAGRNTVAEGVPTAQAVTALAGKLSVDMPICRAVAAILSGRERVGEAIDELLSRPFTVEATGEEIDGPDD